MIKKFKMFESKQTYLPQSIENKILSTFDEEGRETEYFTVRFFGKKVFRGVKYPIEIDLGYAWDCGDGCCSSTEWDHGPREIDEFNFDENELKWISDNIKDNSTEEFMIYP